MIFVDERTGSVELADAMQSRNLEPMITKLDYGDFAILAANGPNGPGTIDVGIERKTIRDMLQCIRTSRFSGHQLPGLLSTYEITWLVVEGNYRADVATGVLQEYRNPKVGGWVDLTLGSSRFMHSELQRFLITLSTCTPLRVWHTRNQIETVIFIADLYQQLKVKEWHQHKSHKGIQTPELLGPMLLRSRTKSELAELRRVRAAMCLTGVGQGKAESVAKKFKSLRAMYASDDWTVPGSVGKTLNENVMQELTEEL